MSGFNVLRDPWIPVWRGGERALCTYPELLTGRCEEATELAYTRVEFRAFGLALLAALTQALFEPPDLDVWDARLEEPLGEEEVRARLDAVAEDFELLGEPGWMQWGERTEEDLTEALVHELSETYQGALLRTERLSGGLCGPCATVALYGFQAFAPAGGRGISPGVRGSPPLTTFVRESTLRRTVWANVLVTRASASAWAKPRERAWRLAPETEEKGKLVQTRRAAGELTLVDGLFWKPRCVRFAVAPAGRCALCGGDDLARLRVAGFRAGARKEDGYFEHPLTPSRSDGEERRTQHVPTERPVWTGLAQMLGGTRAVAAEKSRDAGWTYAAAPVVAQWLAAARPLSLTVFAYRFDNARMEGKFFESYPRLEVSAELLERVQALVDRAEATLEALRRALYSAADEGGRLALFPEDARVEFWRRTEEPFWRAVRGLEGEQNPGDAFVRELERSARALFELNTEPAALEPRRQKRVVRAKRQLEGALAALRGHKRKDESEKGATP